MIVIGGGPAGYPAAIRAAQNKLKVACIDEWKNKDGTAVFGGTCTNAGCIPSKALLESTELYHKTKDELGVHGIKVSGVEFDVTQMQKRKTGIVKASTTGIAHAAQERRRHRAAGPRQTACRPQGGIHRARRQEGNAERRSTSCSPSGSIPTELKSMTFDGKNIVDNWGALDFESVPKKLAVVGAGVIGLELGSVWRRLGSEVVILEALDTFLAVADQGLAKEAARHFKKQGLDIKLGAKVSGAKSTRQRRRSAPTPTPRVVRPSTSTSSSSASAAGRSRKDLLADGTGVQLDETRLHQGRRSLQDDGRERLGRGRLRARPHAGAQGQGRGRDGRRPDRRQVRPHELQHHSVGDLHAPEIAWVGQTEEQVKASGRAYKIGQFPFAASGRARAMESTAGFVKLIAAQDDDEILGVHIIGPLAGELIAEAVLAMEYSASSEDLQRTIHAHPTLSEALHEAALAADKRAIDNINK